MRTFTFMHSILLKPHAIGGDGGGRDSIRIVLVNVTFVSQLDHHWLVVVVEADNRQGCLQLVGQNNGFDQLDVALQVGYIGRKLAQQPTSIILVAMRHDANK